MYTYVKTYYNIMFSTYTLQQNIARNTIFILNTTELVSLNVYDLVFSSKIYKKNFNNSLCTHIGINVKIRKKKMNVKNIKL